MGLDELFTAALGAAPQLGVAGILLTILILVIRTASADRVDFRETLSAAALRHKEEIVRINGDHDAELEELRKEIKELRAQVDALNITIDVERKARREAEDVAAKALRDSYPRHRLEGQS
ncbi:hypothetical protein GCM10017691_23760 [Pseudonocardia petroleophila]